MTESTGQGKLDDFIMELQLTQETAIECLEQARRWQAIYYNIGKKKRPTYNEGDEVLLLRKFIQITKT